MLKLDLHLHSCFSHDAMGSPRALVKSLKSRGLQGMALTDHNTVEGYRQIRQSLPKDFLVIPGIEISTADGHLLGLNVVERIPAGVSVEETVDRILDVGGVPVVPHLFRLLSGIKTEKLRTIQKKIAAIEVFNACSVPSSNLKTAQVARLFDLGGTGGSDTHDPVYAGYAYTVVDSTDLRVDTILSEIQKKKTWGEGATLPLVYRRDRMVLSIKQFIQRGFKRI